MKLSQMAIVMKWLTQVAAIKLRAGTSEKTSVSRNGGVRSGAAALKRAAVKRNNKRKHPKC